MLDYAAEGNCPYCNAGFEYHALHGVCDTIKCEECNRWFVVRTHIDVRYTAHRVEGEVSRLRESA